MSNSSMSGFPHCTMLFLKYIHHVVQPPLYLFMWVKVVYNTGLVSYTLLNIGIPHFIVLQILCFLQTEGKTLYQQKDYTTGSISRLAFIGVWKWTFHISEVCLYVITWSNLTDILQAKSSKHEASDSTIVYQFVMPGTAKNRFTSYLYINSNSSVTCAKGRKQHT